MCCLVEPEWEIENIEGPDSVTRVLKVLEPDARKPARPVLRGGSHGNVTFLPDRRLQTRYTPHSSSTHTTTSFYDPEEEFQEIGIQYGDKTFWKIYGPNTCDAVRDEAGASVVLIHNTLDQLAGIISRQGTVYTQQLPSSYGLQSCPPSIPSDLPSYAQSLSWHSKLQDPTGLIWMGARYYEPKGGRFLSPDPIGYPNCLDLYTYAGGDPVNYLDPDGRCYSSVYQRAEPTILGIKSFAINTWNSPQFQGGLKATAGFIESTTGAALIPTPLAPLGAAMAIHGADYATSGIYMAITGRQVSTMTSQLLQKTGMSREKADHWDDNANFVSTLLGGGLVYKFGKEAITLFRLPPSQGLHSSVTGVHIAEDWAQLIRWRQGAENINSATALRSKLSGLQKAQASPVQIRNLPDGRIRYYTLEVPACKQGLTRGTSYVTEWNPNAGQVRSWMESYDQFGRVNRVHPKMINGQTVTSIHYPPIGIEVRAK